jgi:hypothetical protein
METPPELPGAEERVVVRWLPSVLLDLSPAEPISAVRTPHRVVLQALPSTREGLVALLSRHPFEVVVELETDASPLRHVPVHEIHEARLTPDLPLDWPQYYWLVDGLLDDLVEYSRDPAAALLRGRLRLAVAERVLRHESYGLVCEPADLEAAWARPGAAPLPDVERHGAPAEALQQYVRSFTGHLLEHASSPAFVDRAGKLFCLAEQRSDVALPLLGGSETRSLSLYLQHRLLGSACLTAPAGMIAGWQLLVSAYAVGVWWASLLMASQQETNPREALFTSLWMLDQGLWRDEPLLHDVLRHLVAGEYTSPELAAALSDALSGVHARPRDR